MTAVNANGSTPSSIQHPLAVGTVERKGRHVDFELLAARGDHLVAAGHETRGGRQRHAAGVFEAFARLEHRPLADHAFAVDFLLAARGVGNDPVPGSQLHGLGAGIDNDDGVGPEIMGSYDRGAFRHEIWLDGHFNLAGHGSVHAGKLSRNWASSYRKHREEPTALMQGRQLAATSNRGL